MSTSIDYSIIIQAIDRPVHKIWIMRNDISRITYNKLGNQLIFRIMDEVCNSTISIANNEVVRNIRQKLHRK